MEVEGAEVPMGKGLSFYRVNKAGRICYVRQVRDDRRSHCLNVVPEYVQPVHGAHVSLHAVGCTRTRVMPLHDARPGMNVGKLRFTQSTCRAAAVLPRHSCGEEVRTHTVCARNRHAA